MTRSYDFVCLTKPKGWGIMSLVEAYSVSGGALYWWLRKRQRLKGKLEKIVRKCNKYRMNDKTKLTSLLLMHE